MQEISLWQRKLISMFETLFSLAEMQKAWAYLEPLFIGMCVCVYMNVHMYMCVCVWMRDSFLWLRHRRRGRIWSPCL